MVQNDGVEITGARVSVVREEERDRKREMELGFPRWQTNFYRPQRAAVLILAR
jgi:hypothetical protein